MTATLLDAQVALVEAQRAADLRDLDEAFRQAQRAAFLFLDLRGSTEPAGHRPGGHAMNRAGESPAPTLTLDRPSVPVTPVPPAATGLHSDGRSVVPVAAPPSDTRPPGNRESGGGNS